MKNNIVDEVLVTVGENYRDGPKGVKRGERFYNENGVWFNVFVKGSLNRKPRYKAIWEEINGSIYVSCLSCGVVNKCAEFTRAGYPENTICTVCVKCDSHMFPYLRGYRYDQSKAKSRK